jgi:hypothetical protein
MSVLHSTETCTRTGRVCYAIIYAAHERVCTTAAYPGPIDVSVIQQFCAASRRVCYTYSKLFYSAGDCAAPGRVCYTANYSLLQETVLPLNVSVIQQTVLFYRRLCCP